MTKKFKYCFGKAACLLKQLTLSQKNDRFFATGL